MTSITLNINEKRNNVILGEELRLLWGKPYITDKIEKSAMRYPLFPFTR